MARSIAEWKPVITGRVFDVTGGGPVHKAEVICMVQDHTDTPASQETVKDSSRGKDRNKDQRDKVVPPGWHEVAKGLTDIDGKVRFAHNLEEGRRYRLTALAFAQQSDGEVTLERGCDACVSLPLKLQLGITIASAASENKAGESFSRAGESFAFASVGRPIWVHQEWDQIAATRFISPQPASITEFSAKQAQIRYMNAGRYVLQAWGADKTANSFGEHAEAFSSTDVGVAQPEVDMIGGRVGVALERTAVPPTLDQALWVAIRNRTRAMSFSVYSDFMDRVMCAEDRETFGDARLDRKIRELGGQMHGVGAYQVLKTATEVFLLFQCGVRIEKGRYEHHRLFSSEEESARLGEFVNFDFVRGKLHEYLGTPPHLPYITRVVEAAFPEYLRDGIFSDRVVSCRLNEPCLIELLWSYWHEEGMLVQTMNAISRRFQNVRAPGERDPLQHLEIDPLRHVGNLLWGQIQDDLHVLSVKRRAYEYAHQYGLSLYGRAASAVRPADTRSKFLEAFHNLLHLASVFYKEDNDTTVIADGYPLLNALREVHLILAQGAHNQFGDLPWTARAEMLVMQWIMARPEIREFLQSRVMVPYKEAWMPQVDTMKTVQSWSDITVTHFRDLGVYGEQVLLSVRYGDWINANNEDSAKNWARYWRPEIQAYLHAYRAATGVDLTNPDTVDSTVPAIHLQKRLLSQQRAR